MPYLKASKPICKKTTSKIDSNRQNRNTVCAVNAGHTSGGRDGAKYDEPISTTCIGEIGFVPSEKLVSLDVDRRVRL